MAFKINDFRTHFSKNNEFARADKFEAWITVPTKLGTRFTMQEIALQCEISELPGRAIAMIEQRHYAFINRIPHHNIFPDVNMTFYCNGNMIEKKFFDAWMELMIPVQSGLINYIDDGYTSDITIKQYSNTVGKDGKPEVIYQCTLVNALPTSIAPLQVSWQDDSIHRLPISFAYKKWYNAEMNPEAPALPPTPSSNVANMQPSYPTQEKKDEPMSISSILGNLFGG